MEEITIRGTRAQRNLMEWSQRVADCRSSGLSVTLWCMEHSIKTKTYYTWQKKVFAAMLAQQQAEMSDATPRFAELPLPSTTVERLVQPSKASPRIVFTASGISMLRRFWTLENAYCPMLVSVCGRVIERTRLLYAKANSPIDVTIFPSSSAGTVRNLLRPV